MPVRPAAFECSHRSRAGPALFAAAPIVQPHLVIARLHARGTATAHTQKLDFPTGKRTARLPARHPTRGLPMARHRPKMRTSPRARPSAPRRLQPPRLRRVEHPFRDARGRLDLASDKFRGAITRNRKLQRPRRRGQRLEREPRVPSPSSAGAPSECPPNRALAHRRLPRQHRLRGPDHHGPPALGRDRQRQPTLL